MCMLPLAMVEAKAGALSLEVCSRSLGGKLSLHAADFHPTFESCQAANVVRSWAWVEKNLWRRNVVTLSSKCAMAHVSAPGLWLTLSHEVGGSSS